MSSPLRVVYAGTPDFAVPALQRLIDGPDTVVGVYTQPDRPAGRGRRLRPSPVKQCAERAGIAVFQPRSLRDTAAQVELAGLAPDVLVVAAYGLLLPAAVLDIPRLGCLNIHASLLPRWRGAAPIQRALLAGDDETGVCLMEMVAALDAGPVVTSRSTLITEADTGGSLHDRLSELGAELLMDSLHSWSRGEISARPQDDSAATYAAKLSKDEADFDWNRGADELARQVRAFDPWPVARTSLSGADLRIWRAVALQEAAGTPPPGTVIAAGAGGIDVAAGKGALRILELQPPGRRRQSAAEFLNGHRIAAGVRLGG